MRIYQKTSETTGYSYRFSPALFIFGVLFLGAVIGRSAFTGAAAVSGWSALGAVVLIAIVVYGIYRHGGRKIREDREYERLMREEQEEEDARYGIG